LRPLLCIFALFFLYGGFEATLSGWLSTYSLRYAQLGVAAAAYISTTMWAAFALGRAFAGPLLRYAPERAVRAGGIFIAMTATVVLRGVHTGWGVAACAIAVGFGIAPFFPVTFSILISRHPRPRQAGAATANIGLGSAVLPYLTGLLSTRLGSLHIALLTPIGIALALLILCSFHRSDRGEIAQIC
jgi:fucose permease